MVAVHNIKKSSMKISPTFNQIFLLRFKAFFVHLGLSALIVGIFLGLIIHFWYPPPFLYTQGLFNILLLLISVDLVLGPSLTFIVYNPTKSSLKFDLAFIALIQFSALFYGVYQTFISRPVYVVYSENKFEVVSANEYIDTFLKGISPNNIYMERSLTGPKWIGAKLPIDVDPKIKSEIEFTETFGAGLRVMPKYYTSIENIKDIILKAGKPASELKLSPENLSKINLSLKENQPKITINDLNKLNQWLDNYNLPRDKIILTPLKGFKNYAIVALDRKNGSILGTIELDPWWFQ